MALNISWTRCRYNYGSKNKHTKGLTLCVPGFDKRNEIFDIVAQNWEVEKTGSHLL